MYAALALPMMFAACSQEELFNEANMSMATPDVQGYKIDLVTTKGDVADATRATWNEETAQLGWELTDKISVFWLDGQDGSESLYGNFNSVYKTEDGANFTSESLIYEGGNVAVFPGDLKHTSAKAINIAVPAKQGANPEKNTPFISNRLNVIAADWKNNQAGYQKSLYAPMKQAANVVFFDFTLANTAELVKSYDFTVNKVSLVADKAAFAESAAIVAGNRATYGKDGKLDGNYSNEPASKGTEKKTVNKKDYFYDAVDQVLEVAAEATQNALTATEIEVIDEAAGKYRVKFVVLPTELEAFAATSEIVIETNCGRINLQTKEQSADKKSWNAVAQFSQKPEGDAGKDWKAPAFTGAIYNTKSKKNLTIAETVQQIVSYRRNETAGSAFLGEKVGRTYMLSFEADMANATLNDSKVYTSADIERYVNIYNAMKSSELMNLVLSTEGTPTNKKEMTFMLTKNAVSMVNSCNVYGKNPNVKVTLTKGNADGIQLTDGGIVYLDNANAAMFGNSFDLVELAAGKEWEMNDTYAHDKVNKITNLGTLKVNGTVNKDKKQEVLAEIVDNKGTLNIGGNGILIVGAKLNNSSTVNVQATQRLKFNENTTITGTINVENNGLMVVEKDVTLISTAKINNKGTVSSMAGNGGIINEGTVNVLADDAITYIQNNKKGTIVLKNRNDEVKVENEQGIIRYTYTAEDGADFEYNTEDKFTEVVFKDATPKLILDGDFQTIDMVINGTTTLSVGEATINNLTVNGSLKLLTPSSFYTNELYVNNLKNDGLITIGGKIYYSGEFTGKGEVLSVGDGAIIAAE